MAAALWGAAAADVLSFPIGTLVAFLHNHRMLQVFGRPDDHLASMKRKVELAQAQLDAILGTAPPPSKAATLAGDAVLGQPLRAAGAATAAAAGLANTLATGVAGALPTY